MLAMIDDLIRHKWHANAHILAAVRQHDVAAQNEDLRKLFHHILIANRYWLWLILEKHFVREEEERIPAALDGIIARYKETAEVELDWLERCQQPDMDRTVATPFSPDKPFPQHRP